MEILLLFYLMYLCVCVFICICSMVDITCKKDILQIYDYIMYVCPCVKLLNLFTEFPFPPNGMEFCWLDSPVFQCGIRYSCSGGFLEQRKARYSE